MNNHFQAAKSRKARRRTRHRTRPERVLAFRHELPPPSSGGASTGHRHFPRVTSQIKEEYVPRGRNACGVHQPSREQPVPPRVHTSRIAGADTPDRSEKSERVISCSACSSATAVWHAKPQASPLFSKTQLLQPIPPETRDLRRPNRWRRFPYRKKPDPEDVYLCGAKSCDGIDASFMHKPGIHVQAERFEQPAYFRKILVNLILEVFLADDIHTPVLRAGWCHAGKRDQGIVHAALETSRQGTRP